MDTEMHPAMALALSACFGSVAQWRERCVALAPTPGSPVRLCFDSASASLVVARRGDAPGDDDGVELLSIEAPSALGDIDWESVYERYQHAVHAASAALAAGADAAERALVLDVRRAGVFEQADTMIPGAAWHDPAQVDEWSAELQPGREVLVYCVYGHEVGRRTAMRLRALGVDAHFLEGGIDGWQRAGRPLRMKGETT
ncbi:MAG TPA: rhodanese-like domain-containing protein [Albitalea sp.]